MRKKLYTLIALVSFVVLLAGCKTSSVTPPTGITAGSPAVGTVSSVQVTLGTAIIASSGNTTVTATVRDGAGNAVANANVTFSVISATTGSFAPAAATTNASGVATTVFTANAVNTTATIRASVTSGTTTINGTALITIGTPAPVPTSIVVTLGTGTITNGGTTTVTATVSGTGVMSGITVTFAESVPGAVTFSSTSATTNASGVASVTLTGIAADTSVDISGTAGTLTNSKTLQIGTPLPPVPSSITFNVSPVSVNINGQATLSVTLKDATGLPAGNNAVTFLITASTGTGSFDPLPAIVSSLTVTTNSSGIASTTFYAGTSSGQVNFRASAGALSPKTGSLLITSSPDSISLTAGTTTRVNGQSTVLTADVRNILSQPVSDATPVTFTMTFSGTSAPGALSGNIGYTSNGLATVTFVADAANIGSVFITASAGTAPNVVTSSVIVITVSAAPAGSLLFLSATPNVISIYGTGVSQSLLKFKVLSSTGAALSNVDVQFAFAVSPTGAYLDPVTNVTDLNGEVVTTLHAGLYPGPVRVEANIRYRPYSSGITAPGRNFILSLKASF